MGAPTFPPGLHAPHRPHPSASPSSQFDLDHFSQLAEEGSDHRPTLCEITLDLESGAAARRPVTTAVKGDFPRVPQALVGRKARWAYLATMDTARGVPLFNGVAKARVGSFGRCVGRGW